MKTVKKNLLLLAVVCFGLSITACSADTMYGEPELSVELSDDPKDKDLDWDKSRFGVNPNPNNP